MTAKRFLAAFVCCVNLGFATETSASSWRVNNDQRANADFLDLNAAMASEKVVEGDTLYMDKGARLTNGQTITKRVTIIGPGYFIGENDADEARIDNYLYLRSDGVKVTGIRALGIYVNANDIVVERCHITSFIYGGDTNYECDNAKIISNFITGSITGGRSDCADKWSILNNIIYSTGSYGIYEFSNALIDHNILYISGDDNYYYAIHETYRSTISNNIIFRNSYSDYNVRTESSYNNNFSHNVYNSQPRNGMPANDMSVSYGFNDIFKATGGVDRDTYYELNNLEEIMTFGTDGKAVGAFAGAHPYVMSGFPLYVPRFESVNVPSQPDADGKLNISLVIKNQNE